MEKIATENLFLLEFLVDNLDLGKKCECDAPEGEKCVSFQFLDNAPLDVCEADFDSTPKPKLGTDDNIKSGKSCLFSLSPDQVNECLSKFDILVTIHKKMQPGWLPERIDIGMALISIANLFGELVESVANSDGSTPTAKTLKDVFEVSSPTEGGAPLGKIGVYIRMSCFGKLIVTQFQMNLQDKSVLFKDKEGRSLYRYKKAGKGKGKQDKCSPRPSQPPQQQAYNVDCPNYPCGSPQTMPQAPVNCPFSPCPLTDYSGRYQSQPFPAPCIECGALPNPPCFSQGDMGYSQQITPCLECGSMPYPPCLPPGGGGQNQRTNTPCEECANLQDPPCSEDQEGNYQEIGAAMGGNSLTIRVHKDKNKVEQVDPNAPAVAESNEQCSCVTGLPGKKKKQQQGGQTLAMRPGVQTSPFSFRMGGRSCSEGGNRVVVNPPVATAPDGTQFTEFSDPDKEMFVLRIGKKSEGVDKKQNLELELCTPKGPPLKPLPKKETRDTQYDPLDAGPGLEEGKKGGKDKKGKGGKGKKGKKK